MAAHAGSWQNHILTPLADLDRTTRYPLPTRLESARAGSVQDPADQHIRSGRHPVVGRAGIALTRMQCSAVLARQAAPVRHTKTATGCRTGRRAGYLLSE